MATTRKKKTEKGLSLTGVSPSFTVDDVDRLADGIRERGRAFTFKDPDGFKVSISKPSK